MDRKTQTRYEEQALIIKALAHPRRSFIVEELNRRARCVNELTEMIGSDMSTVSKHLGILKKAGLVTVEKKGTAASYQLRMPCFLNFIRCVESIIEARAFGQMEAVIRYNAQ